MPKKKFLLRDLKSVNELVSRNYPVLGDFVEAMVSKGLYIVLDGGRVMSPDEAIAELKK